MMLIASCFAWKLRGFLWLRCWLSPGDDEWTSRRQLHRRCSHVSPLSWRMSLAHAGRCHESQRSLHLNVESCFGAFLAFFRLVVTRSIFSPMPLSLGVSLSTIWLSRSTSNTDAHGEGETQLRLTASQVGGDFVEPGLKMNCEGCIKVMDEYFVPN